MINTNTGGPAFPHTLPGHQIEIGMTLRDYFAAKAMQSLLSIEGGSLTKDAQTAYMMADEMLKARES